MPKKLSVLVFLPLVCGLATFAVGDEKYSPKIAGKSAEAERAIRQFKIPAGMTAKVFAAEPMLANPVAFCFDDSGRIYVAETFRQQKGVEDNRFHMSWLLDDLAAQTVADRLAYFKNHLKEDVQKYAVEHDRIRLLEDTDHDGEADKSTIYADGFNAIEEGTGAGLLALNNDLFYTCIPKLWRLKDVDGDGIADTRTALLDGFGVRVAFRGHDMHGLVLGPDGRIYFSIGDRGYNVELKDRPRIAKPDQGAVFRCDPDGSNFEVFCTGLRNPQELAFDEFGNLFTGDNNSDSGDRARWTYLTEGSDTGWRMYYQYPADRGPWNREQLWHLSFPGQAAYIVPPVAHFADGPAGLTYYPGTGLDERYRGHFFLADFRGQASNSGIRSFSLIPKGASFELVNAEEYIWSILATDVDFGFDGGIYVTDWVDGWDGSGKGRIYQFRDAKNGQSPVVNEVSTLMKEGFESRSPQQLSALLVHSDYRIRQRAQLALVQKQAIQELVAAAINGTTLFARLHGIWGLGQLGRRDPKQLQPILKLLDDKEPEVRAQLARVIGDAVFHDGAPELTRRIKDGNPRVQALAAIAVGKLKYRPAVAPLLEALAENNNADPTLRHALVMGLVGTATPEELIATTRMPIPAIRLGAVVALRRFAHPGLASFLRDSESLIVVESVRAIHDVPVDQALPAVAKLIGEPGLSDPVLRRALSANFRIGTKDCADAVAMFAANPLVDDHLRVEAVNELSDWNAPGPLDRVTNEYRPIPAREIDIAAVVRPRLGPIFSGSPKMREAAAKLATRHGITDVEPYLVEILKDSKNSVPTLRVAALTALNSIKSPRLADNVEVALADVEPSVRSEARRILTGIDPERGVKLLANVHSSDSVLEQQAAISTLAALKRIDADKILLLWLDKLLAGTASPSVALDLLDAARMRGTTEFLARIQKFESSRRSDDHLRNYRECESGGDETRGRDIFFSRSEASCRRCHKVDGSGSDVGPDLSRIGLEKRRDYLLESIVDPNKQIAKGFETAILEMSNGKVYAGIIKREDDQIVQLQQPDGQLISIDKSEIEDRAVGKSGMPEDLIKKLTKSEIRDLVEYLSTRKSVIAPAGHGKATK